MRKLLALTAATVLLAGAAPCFGWDKDGHRLIGVMAWHHMNPKSKACVAVLLQDQSLADAGTWADDIVGSEDYEWSRPLHYLNVPRDAKKVEAKKHCPTGDCILGAINRFSNIIRDKSSTRHERVEALKFLVHFVEDLHQPLHVSHADDGAGNEVNVKWLGEDSTLHAVWDRQLIERRLHGEDRMAYATRLRKRMSEQQLKFWKGEKINPEAWANESLMLTRKIYAELPPNRMLDKEYFDRNIATVEERLQVAGVRLASVLNSVFEEVDLKVRPADFLVFADNAEPCGELGGKGIYLVNNHPLATIRADVRRTMTVSGSTTRKVLTFTMKPGERRWIECSRMRMEKGGGEATIAASVVGAQFVD